MTETKRLPILCVDFDGVINSYKSGWVKAHIIPDPPVKGAMQFLRAATDHFQVCIFSSRTHQEGGQAAMQDYIEFWAASENPTLLIVSDPWVKKLRYPLEKPPAKVSLDDRGWQFNGTFPSMEELLNFKAWWEK